jgi:periplasmic protein CpxP/Spy
MHKLVVTLVSAALMAVATADAYAQDATPRFLPPEQVVQFLANKLSLSDEQKTAITPLILERQAKMKEALAENNAGTQQRRREVMGIFSDSDSKIKALLNPDQQQKYAEVERQVIEQMKQRAQAK